MSRGGEYVTRHLAVIPGSPESTCYSTSPPQDPIHHGRDFEERFITPMSLEELEFLINEAKAVLGLDNQAGAFTYAPRCQDLRNPHLTLVVNVKL